MVAKACGERRGGLVCPATASVPAIGVQNSSHLGASVTFTVPFTFSRVCRYDLCVQVL